MTLLTTSLDQAVAAVPVVDEKAVAAGRARLAAMTKPPGSLGRLEDLAVQLCGVARACPPPPLERGVVVVVAGDHGVHAQGVTPWPQEVTVQMVRNFLAGGAVVNAFARQLGVEVVVVDAGVAAELARAPGLIDRKIRYGTADLATGPAMTVDEAARAVEVGVEVGRSLAADHDHLVTGDMGIANTTPSAALVAAWTGAAADVVTGRGTGVARVPGAPTTPTEALAALAEVGGLEHGVLAGVLIGAAEAGVPVVLDGVIAGAAALVAVTLCPAVRGYLVAGHVSAEPGHRVALDHLGLEPVLELGLRLGEGTGGLLAAPVLAAAARAMNDVATFGDAGVTDRT